MGAEHRARTLCRMGVRAPHHRSPQPIERLFEAEHKGHAVVHRRHRIIRLGRKNGEAVGCPNTRQQQDSAVRIGESVCLPHCLGADAHRCTPVGAQRPFAAMRLEECVSRHHAPTPQEALTPEIRSRRGFTARVKYGFAPSWQVEPPDERHNGKRRSCHAVHYPLAGGTPYANSFAT